MQLTAGTRLGPYEIVAPIGAGGMGEVFRAKDTRLDRSVAIKVLPSHLASNPQLRERFDREARAISALNHPNICTLHDVGHQDGIDYIVMELLEGETLADRLARGPLPISDVLKYGIEIATGLDKAHRHAITHRDLKPGNIIISKSGAKLLDFGLAKMSSLAIGPDAPTEQHKPLTAEGTILGTFQYMAPEQLEGKDADPRTDIFAFGAVLYEMVTGRRAFEGKSKTNLIAAIVDRDPPPLSSLQPLTPPALERVITTCLAKDPEDRWQTAHDVLLQLRWIAEAGSQAGAAAPLVRKRKHREWLAWSVAAMLLLTTVGASMFLLKRDRPTDSRLEFDVYPPPNSSFNSGDGPVVVSPDGRHLAFRQTQGIGVRSLISSEIRTLAGTDGAYDLFWSPDSLSIGFFRAGKMMRVDAAGGSPRTVAKVGSSLGGSWSKSGVIIFTPDLNVGLSRVGAEGGPVSAVTSVVKDRELGHWRPYFLGDGEHFIYFSRGKQKEASGVYLGSLSSHQTSLVMPLDVAPVLALPNHLLFISENSLLAQRFDVRSGKPEGTPVAVAEAVDYSEAYASLAASASSNGVFAYQTRGTLIKTTILRLDRSGKEISKLTDQGGTNLDLSRDDKRLAFQRADAQSRSEDIWVLDLQRSTTSRVTFDPASDVGPVWSPDSTRLAFSSNRDQAPGIYIKEASGAGGETFVQPLTQLGGEPVDWSRDGKFLLYESGQSDLYAIPIAGGGKPIPIAANPTFAENSGRFSPAGGFISYLSFEAGRADVCVQPFPATGAKWQIATGASSRGAPQWSRSGKELFYVSGNKMYSVSIVTSPAFEASVPTPLFDIADPGFVVAGDGQSFYIGKRDETQPQPIHVVLNWKPGSK